VTVFLVYPDNIPGIWKDTLPLLQKPIKRSGTHSEDDVLGAVMDGRAQLWIQKREYIDAVAVTEIVSYPRMRMVHVWLAGARRKADWKEFNDVIVRWGRERACKFVKIDGRVGWLRVVPGMEAVSVVMRMPI
jgi:hypothetical protein